MSLHKMFRLCAKLVKLLYFYSDVFGFILSMLNLHIYIYLHTYICL